MEFETIIFNSELEFRNYVVQNMSNVKRILIFQDSLDDVIFFYGILQDYFYIATKDFSCNKFDYYKDIYTNITINDFQPVLNYKPNRDIEFLELKRIYV